MKIKSKEDYIKETEKMLFYQKLFLASLSFPVLLLIVNLLLNLSYVPSLFLISIIPSVGAISASTFKSAKLMVYDSKTNKIIKVHEKTKDLVTRLEIRQDKIREIARENITITNLESEIIYFIDSKTKQDIKKLRRDMEFLSKKRELEKALLKLSELDELEKRASKFTNNDNNQIYFDVSPSKIKKLGRKK